MSYLDRIAACNNLEKKGFIPFKIGQQSVGLMRPTFINEIQRFPEVFLIDDSGILLHPRLNSFEARSEALVEVNEQLFTSGIIRRRPSPENYAISGKNREDAYCVLERAAAPHYGIRAYGQHLNGYIRTESGIKMWVGVRAKDKPNEPGKLDQIVAGGLPWPLTEIENLIKECDEEANIPQTLATQAVPVGYVSYRAETPEGAKPDTMLCYDLELSTDFVPSCNDGEVDRFELMTIEDVAERVRSTEDFKANCNLVIIDFLIRHGYLTEADPDFQTIHSQLRQAVN